MRLVCVVILGCLFLGSRLVVAMLAWVVLLTLGAQVQGNLLAVGRMSCVQKHTYSARTLSSR